MDFMNSLIQLLGVFLSSPFLRMWYYPLIAMAFLATIPYLFRAFFYWR